MNSSAAANPAGGRTVKVAVGKAAGRTPTPSRFWCRPATTELNYGCFNSSHDLCRDEDFRGNRHGGRKQSSSRLGSAGEAEIAKLEEQIEELEDAELEDAD